MMLSMESSRTSRRSTCIKTPVSSPAALPPSSSTHAAQCYLNEAMELLDLPPDAGILTTTSVAKAYDCLLLAVDKTASVVWAHLDDNSQLNAWTNVQADTYRALLLSAHLMLGMAQRERSNTENTATNENDERRDTSCEVVLNQQDVSTLKQTQRRCKLLLLELNELIRLRYNEQETEKSRGDDDEDWHDNVLPRSNFQLLRECLELSETPNGSKVRLVSLHLNVDEETFDLSEEINGDEAVNTDVIEDNIGEKMNRKPPTDHSDSEQNDGEDICSIGFDRRLLEKEENALIDIAMPETVLPVAQNGERTSKKRKKRKRNDKLQGTHSTTNGERTTVAKQGYLVQVNSTGSGDNASASSTRCLVKLSRSGLLSVQPVGGKKTNATIYYLADGCQCQPRTVGDTFHFFVSCAKLIVQVDAHHSEEELLFKVDDETGGGLVEGFDWVTAFTDVAAVASSTRQRQGRIRNEWAEDEWKERAQYRSKDVHISGLLWLVTSTRVCPALANQQSL